MAICTTTPNIYNLGTYGHCETVSLPIEAPVTGTYRAEWEYRDNIVCVSFDVESGDNIPISTAWFNESSVAVLNIYDPSGQLITTEVEPSVLVSNFKLTVKIKNCVSTSASPDPDINYVVVEGSNAYSSDSLAAADGVLVGEFYEVGPAHEEGAVEGTIKKRIV